MIAEAIYQLSKRENLTEEILKQSFIEIIEGKASAVQTAAFLMGLTTKGETLEEILSTVKLFREYSIKIKAPQGAIDIVGTGGDRAGTFNVSTATSFVVAAAGVPVAKHGNRSASSKCGSIDVLEELGINVEMPPDKAEKCLFECGLTVLFAPIYHPAMKRVVPVRKELGIRTIFNILGPMLNPAGVKRLLIGVFGREYMEIISQVLSKLGVEDVMVVHSEDGLDEISLTSNTHIIRAKNGEIEYKILSPEELGFKRISLNEIKGGDRKENAQIILDILKGKKGPLRDTVLVNSAAALEVAGKAKNLKEGLEMAKEAIDSGKAYNKLEQLKKISNA